MQPKMPDARKTCSSCSTFSCTPTLAACPATSEVAPVSTVPSVSPHSPAEPTPVSTSVAGFTSASGALPHDSRAPPQLTSSLKRALGRGILWRSQVSPATGALSDRGGKALLSIKNNPKRHTTQAPPSGGPKPVLTPSATLSSRFNPVGRSNTRRAVSDGILPPEEGIRVTRHRWLSTVNVRWHFEPSPFVVHVSGSEIYHMVLTCVRIVYAKSLQIKR